MDFVAVYLDLAWVSSSCRHSPMALTGIGLDLVMVGSLEIVEVSYSVKEESRIDEWCWSIRFLVGVWLTLYNGGRFLCFLVVMRLTRWRSWRWSSSSLHWL